MKRVIYIAGVLIVLFSACEDIYNPEIEQQDPVLVVDARIIHGQNDNFIRIYNSLGFNEAGNGYPEAKGATATLVDDENIEYSLPERTSGYFYLNFLLDDSKKYKLKVVYNGETYESDFESIPDVPEMDSVYGFAETKILQQGGVTDVNDFLERPGVMLYTDINNQNKKFYRFSARKTFQYVYYIPDPMFGELAIYAWKTIFPVEAVNIAAPARYSASAEIKKHPLYFMEQRLGHGSELEFMGREGFRETFMGWILFLHQYSISENAYNFYKDVNSQLQAEGRLFDPLYVQARNNLKCVTNKEKLVLGNFEISAQREYRFYVRFVSNEEGYLIKPIPYFYNIPLEGESVQEFPDFWEYPSKKYPNE